MTIVGAVNKDNEKIEGNVNPIQWINRIVALTSPVKKQTQEYMIEHIIKQNNNNNGWVLFDYTDPLNEVSLSSVFGWTSFNKTKSLSEDMITKNRMEVERHMENIVLERFNC